MTSKHIKMRSTLLLISDFQIKITAPRREGLKLKRFTASNIGLDMGVTETFSHCWWVSV